MATRKKSSRRKPAAAAVPSAFIGARRVGSKVVVFTEVVSRKRGRSQSKIVKRTLPLSGTKASTDWMSDDSLGAKLLSSFQAAVKEAKRANKHKANR